MPLTVEHPGHELPQERRSGEKQAEVTTSWIQFVVLMLASLELVRPDDGVHEVHEEENPDDARDDQFDTHGSKDRAGRATR